MGGSADYGAPVIRVEMTEMAVIPHVSVMCLTSFVHVVCSSVISPRLIKAWPRATRLQHVKEHRVYLMLGYLAHSLVVGSIALFCFLSFDSADSSLPLIAVARNIAFVFRNRFSHRPFEDTS